MAQLFVIITLLAISAIKASSQDEKSCDAYLQMISDFPDGYRAHLTLPVLENMPNGWTIKITYTEPLRNFDTSMADVTRSSRDVSLVPRPQYQSLKSPGSFKLDFTIHHARDIKKSMRIASIEFGSFRCGAGSGGLTETCEKFVSILNEDLNHQLFDLHLPISENNNNVAWQLQMGFTKPLSCFKHLGASILTQIPSQTTNEHDWTTFRVVSTIPEHLKSEKMFVKRFDTKFKNRAVVSWIKFGKFECRGNKLAQ